MDDVKEIYSTPKANLSQASKKAYVRLASRKRRLVAATIDGLIAICFAGAFAVLIGPSLDYTMGQVPNGKYLFASSIFGYLLFAALHGHLLKNYGQTIGKKLLGIQIIGMDNKQLTLIKILFLRCFSISIITTALMYIPTHGVWASTIAGLINILFIFGTNRRCIHDLIAGTKVIYMVN